MNSLLDSGLARDIGVFAGAFVSLFALKSMQKPPDYAALSHHPLIRASPLAILANELVKLEQPCIDSLNIMERFLTLVSSRDVAANGFAANRLATDIQTRVKEVVCAAQRSDNLDIVRRAIDFQRDEMDQIAGICDNLLRNMLLDGQHM